MCLLVGYSHLCVLLSDAFNGGPLYRLTSHLSHQRNMDKWQQDIVDVYWIM